MMRSPVQPSLSMLAAALLMAMAIAGCSSSPDPPPQPAASTPGTFSVECRVLASDQAPLATASCGFEFGELALTLRVDSDGKAELEVPANQAGTVRATAPGHEPKTQPVVVDGPKRVTFTLARMAEADSTADVSNPDTSSNASQASPPPPVPRSWEEPVQVYRNDDGGSVSEPMLDITPKGTILYAPNSYGQGPFRSMDGGRTFQDIAANLGQTLPTMRSDTSVDIAPDGTVWYARSVLDLANVMVCSSGDEGDSWTCNEFALPGPTDRMWVIGLDAKTAYVQALFPHVYVAGPVFAYYHAWFKTTDGGATFTPYATTTQYAFPSGNMVHDEKSSAVLQLESVGDELAFARIDQGAPLLAWKLSGLAGTTAIPWLSIQDGVLWTSSEPARSDGSRSLVLARSRDLGSSWDRFTIPTQTGTLAFSYVSAGPNGRVAAVYYGSEVAKVPGGNGGTWSVYVVETSNGLDPFPTWVETRIADAVHTGSICMSAGCESNTDDPYARFSLDLIGIKLDADGNVHVAYVSDAEDHEVIDHYRRQRVA